MPQLGVEPPAFLFVLNKRDDEVAGQAVFRRHPLHLALPQSDEPVVEGGKDGAVCLWQ